MTALLLVTFGAFVGTLAGAGIWRTRAVAAERIAGDLYWWIVTEFDSDPGPLTDYLPNAEDRAQVARITECSGIDLSLEERRG